MVIWPSFSARVILPSRVSIRLTLIFLPGGGNFGPDGRYYVGARSARTIMAFSIGLGATGEYVLPAGIVPFPRGFAFGHDGRFFLASGIDPSQTAAITDLQTRIE